MKNGQARIVALLLPLLCGAQLMAQTSGPVTGASNEMDAARALLISGREDIVREEMRFSEDEAAAFWPLYNSYQADIRVVNDRYASLLTSYLDDFRKALPARKAARFYQLENKMDAELQSQLALIIPLIDPV